MIWTISAARTKLSEVIRLAHREGPQVISVRGIETAVVLAKAEFDRLRGLHRSR